MNDEGIISLLNKRDESAVAALMDKYGALCRSLIGHILRDRRDVEECANNVLLRLWASIPPASPRDLKAYVAKTARNEALMRVRSNRAKGLDSQIPLDELELFLPGSENTEEAAELKDLIERFLKSQSRERRGVFIRRYWLFEPVDEIARALGMSESKVKSLLFRTRNALREYLEKEGGIYG